MEDLSKALAAINNQTLIIAAPALLLVAALVAYIVWQRRKITKLEYSLKPKYGFLGKSLYSTLAAFIMLSAFGVTYWASQQSGNFTDVSANKKLELQFMHKVVGTQAGGYLVEFSVVPTINGKPWGNNGQEQFDVFWKLSGTLETSEVELARSIAKPSKYQVVLPSGSYLVKVDVFGDNVDKSQEMQIRVP